PRKVVQVLDRGKRLLVSGVNQLKKHVRRGHPKSPQGGHLMVELPIDSSKVKFYCDKCNKGVRIGFRYLANGAKERFCKSCQASAGIVSPANPRRAKNA
ncbi:MAG: 50S ribosomal protein L24, partial [Cryobacterium sp.]|nr:50S ribosomal protein L24 [Cryobacterium sp.]